MLHIINKAPLGNSSLDSCLRVAQGGDILGVAASRVFPEVLERDEGMRYACLSPVEKYAPSGREQDIPRVEIEMAERFRQADVLKRRARLLQRPAKERELSVRQDCRRSFRLCGHELAHASEEELNLLDEPRKPKVPASAL